MVEHAHIVTVDQEPCEQCLDREHQLLRLQGERDQALGANQMYRLEMGQAYDDMKAERDTLLEALRTIEGYTNFMLEEQYVLAVGRVNEMARKAIANVEGKDAG